MLILLISPMHLIIINAKHFSNKTLIYRYLLLRKSIIVKFLF